MSDNLSTTKQAAATKTKSAAIDTMPSSSEVAHPESASQADSEATTVRSASKVPTEGVHYKDTDDGEPDTTDAPAVSQQSLTLLLVS